jgi:hypothetical protein
MSAAARRRRVERKKNPFNKAVPGILVRDDGCRARCPECLTRCMVCCDSTNCARHAGHDEHWFACDH